MSAETPWEKVAVMNPHVIWDAQAGLYKMWYSGGEQYEPNAIGYATSRMDCFGANILPTPFSLPIRRMPGSSTK